MIINLKNVSVVFEHKILDEINIQFQEKEIVSILGRSGCGKSTLLRVITELIEPTSGTFENYSKSTAMVFQSFALFPWMTVKENLLVVMRSSKDCENRAKALIAMMGLGGYENAYPREISGGMKQRVGIARAIAINPEVMVMDEPFSALDQLTANTLKSDLMDFWIDSKTSLKSIIIVTHSVEEAVMLSDRVLILAAGKVVEDMQIKLNHPRDKDSAEVKNYVDNLYSILAKTASQNNADIYYQMPLCSSNTLYGLLVEISENEGITMSDIEQEFQIETSEILKILEFLSLLKFIVFENSSIKITASGKIISEADAESRKKIFAEHVIPNMPLISFIYKNLENKKTFGKSKVLKALSERLSLYDAEKVIKASINWARHAEVFLYDDAKQVFMMKSRSK